MNFFEYMGFESRSFIAGVLYGTVFCVLSLAACIAFMAARKG